MRRVGRGKTWLESSGWSSGVDELRSLQLLIRHVRWELQSDSVEPFADWLKRSETRIILCSRPLESFERRHRRPRPDHRTGGPGKVKRKGFTGSGNRKPRAWERLVFVLNPPTTPHHKRQERVKLSPTGRWNLGIARNCHVPGVTTLTLGHGLSGSGLRKDPLPSHTHAGQAGPQRPGNRPACARAKDRAGSQRLGKWSFAFICLIGQNNGYTRAQQS